MTLCWFLKKKSHNFLSCFYNLKIIPIDFTHPNPLISPSLPFLLPTPPPLPRPAIIFIDEIDAIATKRFDAQTGADREVQRILLELLNQMDGFDQTVNVKVIMATNRADTLDPALLRPGRLDR